MNIQKVDAKNHQQVREFCSLPFRIYQDIPQWVPPLQGEIEDKLDPNKNPFFKHSEAIILLAMDGQGHSIGRLAILNNRRYNDFNHEKTAFFTLFESINDFSVASSLFQTGIEWAKQHDLNLISGPKGFNALDGLGLLIKGFDHRPAFGIPYNPSYYPEMIERLGFQKTEDIVSGYLKSGDEFPEEIHEISKKVQLKKGLRVERFKKRSELRKLIPKLRVLYNASLEGTRGNVPLTDDEIGMMADQMLNFADPRFIKILFKDEELVGYLFAYPDISAALQRQKGKIFPIGWIDMLREMKKSEWININGAGIISEFRGMGGTAILFSEMHRSVMEGGFKHVDIVQVGVENDRMQNDLRRLGIDFYKTHRMYAHAL